MSTTPVTFDVAPSVSRSMRSRITFPPSMRNVQYMFAHMGSYFWTVIVPLLNRASPR